MLLPIALILVGIIGFLAQSVGLCMARGVNECRNGKPEFLLAVLLSGVLAWVAVLYSSYFKLPSHFTAYQADVWFALGGLIFGLGTAFNQGCGVSTLSKLARGDSRMIFTLLGWLIGWTILAVWDPVIDHTLWFFPEHITLATLASSSIALLIWALVGDKKRQKLWLTMMTIGLVKASPTAKPLRCSSSLPCAQGFAFGTVWPVESGQKHPSGPTWSSRTPALAAAWPMPTRASAGGLSS